MTPTRPRLVIVGSGMVSHALVEKLVARHYLETHEILVLGEESRLAYDRVHLSARFAGDDAESLQLAHPDAYAAAGVACVAGERVVAIGRDARTVTCASGTTYSWDSLVLATGSSPFVPELSGRDRAGCFVYRTIDDVDAIRAYAARARRAIVIGGGLLGLEAAGGLARLGLETHVVELAPRLMAVQLDEQGGQVLRAKIEALGVRVHVGARSQEILAAPDGSVAGLRLADGTVIDAEMVVFSAGIRARDELARAAGLTLGARGGVAIDGGCRTSDPAVLAIGECAAFEDRTFGLVAPGYQMAEVAAATLTGGSARFTAPDLSTQLKLMGVDVAAIGDGLGLTPGAQSLTYLDTEAGVYKKLVVSADRKRLLGGLLVGDAKPYAEWLGIYRRGAALPEAPEALLVPARAGAAAAGGVAGLPADATICSCLNVSKGAVCDAVVGKKLTTVPAVKACTKAGTGCGSCVPLLADLLTAELTRAGVAVNRDLCEHFAHTRQELYHLVKVGKIRSFEALVERHGRGEGCEVCKPAVASILASAWNEHVLDRKHLPLQDTNDRFLANIQRDGTYSVVPRVPAGEITPDQLIVLGQVAKKYGLYTKITGGQRVDLFGARVEQLPQIWRELIDAGFESGHAYGKALRTVKSCVGSTWCRYGVQDSVGLALRLEHRYKGLRSPHKLKSAVSGCARECAEAQGKDFGVIATEKGYNLYLCGNGGMKPAHAQLFAVDLDEATVVRYLDRFLMFYIRTADRLQRTATWLQKLEGGMDYLRRVVIDDELGIAAELEAEMAGLVASYECEWKATLEDEQKLRRFRPFVNAPGATDPSIVFIRERGQARPATWEEKEMENQRGTEATKVAAGGGS
jgi:nitrite reductase (NADH) large subunit